MVALSLFIQFIYMKIDSRKLSDNILLIFDYFKAFLKKIYIQTYPTNHFICFNFILFLFMLRCLLLNKCEYFSVNVWHVGCTKLIISNVSIRMWAWKWKRDSKVIAFQVIIKNSHILLNFKLFWQNFPVPNVMTPLNIAYGVFVDSIVFHLGNSAYKRWVECSIHATIDQCVCNRKKTKKFYEKNEIFFFGI